MINLEQKIQTMPLGTKMLYYLGIFAVLAVSTIVLESSALAQGVVVLFGICALLFRIPSDESFRMALIAFGVIALSAIVNSNILMQSFATYAFLLLCIGTICALKEEWHKRRAEARTQTSHSNREEQAPIFVSRRMRRGQ